MPRGGVRPGAGRPKKVSHETVLAAYGAGLSPLEYMLKVIRDETVDVLRRDRMAVAAASYCHPKVADSKLGKKDATATAARKAGQGTDWGDDLASNVVALRK